MRNPARTSSASTLARSSAAAHSTRRSNETALLWALLPLRPFYPHTAMRRGPLGAHSRGASPLPPPPSLPTPLPPIPPASSPLTSSPPARPLPVAGPQRPGKLLRPRQRLRTPGDGDLRGLAQERPVLGQEFSRHRELGGAQVGIRRKRRELALGKLQFKGVEGHIRRGLEGARGDAVLDERRADQLDCDAIALEHHRQVGERFAPVRYEVGGTG